MTIPVVLASQSPSRARLLVHAGIRPTIRVSHVDEDAVLASLATDRGVHVNDLSVEERVLVLARAKAQAAPPKCAAFKGRSSPSNTFTAASICW